MDEEEDLETLGEKLYNLIYPKHKETAGKLTGELTCRADCYFFSYIKNMTY